ncbi:hypothetical protein OfM2_10020 [Lactovum odontotermitis]
MNFYVTNCFVYAVFTAVLFALGWLILHQSSTVQSIKTSEKSGKMESAENPEAASADTEKTEENELPEEGDFDGWNQKDS